MGPNVNDRTLHIYDYRTTDILYLQQEPGWLTKYTKINKSHKLIHYFDTDGDRKQ